MEANYCIRKRKQQAFLLALGWNILLALIAVGFNTFEFGTNDDRDISNILANVTGVADTHYIAFVNVILTKGFYLLYQWTNNYTNWYTLISVFASFCALTAVSYLLILRAPKMWIGSSLAILMIGCLYDHHYIIFQFTQNATLLTAAGCLMLADGVLFGKENSGPIQLIVGVLLALFGSMIRFSAVYFAFPYLAMFVGYEVVFVKKPLGFRQWKKIRHPQFIAIFVCILLVFGANGLNNYVFSSDPMLKEFRENNSLRAELLDYGFPSYEENAEELQEMGLSPEDIALFTAQCYIDRSIFNQNVMERLVQMKSVRGVSYSMENLAISSLKQVYRAVKTDLKNALMWRVILICCVLYLCASSHKRWLVGLGSLAVPLIIIWYFVSVQRIPDRVWYSIMAPSVISILYLCAVDGNGLLCPLSAGGDNRRKFRKVLDIICAALLVVALGLVGVAVWERAAEDDESTVSAVYENILTYAQEHSDTLVLLDRPTVSALTYKSTIPVLRVPARGSHQNICYQGGWICWTPANLSVLDNFGVTNVYEAIANGMEVIMIDGRDPEAKLEFIRRHYNEDVCLKKVGTVRGSQIGIYRFQLSEVDAKK